MKTIAAISACAMLAFAAPAFAQNSNTSNTPGHQMQENGPKAGSPGASGYAPGHQNDATGTGAGSTGGMSEGRSSTTDMDSGTSRSGTSGKTGGGQINSGSGGSSGTGGASGSGSAGGTAK